MGLHLAELLQPGTYDIVECAARASADLREALARLVRYQRLLDDSVEIAVVDGGGPHVSIVQRHEIPPHLRVHHAPECFFAALLGQGRRLAGRPWAPKEMRFRHARPGATEEHERLFACPVRFGAREAAMVVSRDVLALPVVTGDPAVAAVLARYADELLGRLPLADDPVTRAKRALSEALGCGGDPSLPAVASRLGTTPRTLQRALEAQGTTHRALLDERRKDRGVTLAAGDLAFDEVAFLLGFSEISAFYRAFKRWTGTTPASFRDRAQKARSARPLP
jgi:AraC-like DNA-binding protein